MSQAVSAIIPAFRAETTIIAAVRSAARQTFTDSRIVVVDDASADDTAVAAERALAGIARGRLVVLGANGGPAAARNRGIAESDSEWLAFLDGDDAWLPYRLELQLAEAEKYPDVVLFCGGTAALEQGEDPASRQVARPERVESRELMLRDLAVRNCIATSTVLVKRRVVEEAGGFDESFRGPEDFDLWLRVVARGKARTLPCPLSLYRHVPGSLSMDDRTFLPEVLRVLEKAYGPGGALHGVRARRRAVAFQYLCASWMAADRRDFGRAWALYWRGICSWPWSFRPYLDAPWQRVKLFVGLVKRMWGKEHRTPNIERSSSEAGEDDRTAI